MRPARVIPFCAICTGEIRGAVSLEPLGKNDALVAVCSGCTTEKPSARLGPERGYEVMEGGSQQHIAEAADRVARSLGKPPVSTRGHVLGRNMDDRTPGWILVRVARRPGLDVREALRSLSHEPWFRELRVLGVTLRYHLFERPDPKVASANRRRSTDLLEDLTDLARPRRVP